MKTSTQCFAKATAPALDFSSHGSFAAAAEVLSEADGAPVGSEKRGSGSSVQPASDSTAATRLAATIPRITPPEEDSNLDRQRSARPEVIVSLWTTTPTTVTAYRRRWKRTSPATVRSMS